MAPREPGTGSGGTVRNPLFARLLVRMRRNEPAEQLEHRRELLRGLSGRVLDLGASDGANFPYFPSTVTEVIAVEPEPYLRGLAERSAGRAPVPVRVVDALAERLPLDDASVDAAVVALVLCSVPDQSAALRELHRVVRPGGELRVFEHVVADDRRLAALQRFLERSGIWPRIAGGCHPARDTASAIEDAGFTIDRLRGLSVKPCRLAFPVAPHILGAARRPTDP
ncbi:MAG TPA: class I SAM-dependent methyltransferase [Thermoleophilaceae bacterium]|nr:class I SAM-dependent methyltransferase [Thermoleophilaceae bacterium]